MLPHNPVLCKFMARFGGRFWVSGYPHSQTQPYACCPKNAGYPNKRVPFMAFPWPFHDEQTSNFGYQFSMKTMDPDVFD
jgi:hypothetical protein